MVIRGRLHVRFCVRIGVRFRVKKVLSKYIFDRFFLKCDIMGLDLLPMLPCALPSGSAVAIVGRRARPKQDCQNGRFFSSYPMFIINSSAL
jgi:hypothetical protein